ncbi:hypothetical protein [Nocardia huaxiensis]|uniref:hypothetical protein n=1 Tax=Nocardia huaxiensis TaxID=2755382 RepID=UPI001E42A918|nr:hypothetical protein [Nocardia huaxiensis]UFS94297.1 hypothetical protein LPY97_26495 [Nocardia huaxiensis]
MSGTTATGCTATITSKTSPEAAAYGPIPPVEFWSSYNGMVEYLGSICLPL